MLNHVSFADNSEWNDLLNAIRSGGGGGGSPISIDATQWQDLIRAIRSEGGGVNYINIPQSDFTYISSNKSFSVDLSNYNITKDDILAIGVYCESGASVWGGNITSNNELEVTGWCPFLSRAIDENWLFTCNIILK